MTLVAVSEAHRFMVDCLVHVGTSWKNAMSVADVLIEADSSGHFSHGLNRLEMYVNDIKRGFCISNAVPYIIKETVSTAWVDGCEGLGPIVGHYCMEVAIKKAKATGIACVTVKGSHHYGIAGWYSRQALKHNMVVALGSNPISFAAPGNDDDSFVLDMATTTTSLGKVEYKKLKNEKLPKGCALGEDGNETTDPVQALKVHHLMPLGGSEETAGYKGYGLALLVETLCGILSGGDFGPNIVSRLEDKKNKSLKSHCFIVIDPNCFAPAFQDRMSDLMNHLRNLSSVDKDKPVLVHGDLEKAKKEEVLENEGIYYLESQLKASAELAQRLGVRPIKEFQKHTPTPIATD
ncbi:putative oxidoreductase YjmC isoform X2 [Lycorma delicatula]|uniref:putative oxidoreductase YjmC isoform X2 n=1 Tax=Lycorma delicatula TaxID=130591 RepID=UPI003F515D68